MATSAIDLNKTLGALLLGNIVASILYGITSLQAFLYYKDSQQDGLSFRLLIAFLWLLDSLHTIFVTHGSYHYLIVEYMNPAALSSPTWSILSLVIMTCISDSIVRCIFARRVWRLSRRNNYLLLVIVAASVFVFSKHRIKRVVNNP